MLDVIGLIEFLRNAADMLEGLVVQIALPENADPSSSQNSDSSPSTTPASGTDSSTQSPSLSRK